MLFYLIEKSYRFVCFMAVFTLILYYADISRTPSATFIYPEMDTLYNCFSEVFFQRLKYVHILIEPFAFLKNTLVYKMLQLFFLRVCFLVYGHINVIVQCLFFGFCFGYASISILRNYMFSFKGMLALCSFFILFIRYLAIFLMFQCMSDLIYLTSVVLLLSVFLLGIRLAVIFFVG